MAYYRSSWCERGEHEKCRGQIWVEPPLPSFKGPRGCRCACHEILADGKQELLEVET